MSGNRFDTLISKFGTPERAQKAEPVLLSALSGKLPDTLLAFWESHGRNLGADQK